jgi:hypothetical protein
MERGLDALPCRTGKALHFLKDGVKRWPKLLAEDDEILARCWFRAAFSPRSS